MNKKISKVLISTAVLFALTSFGCGRNETLPPTAVIPGAVTSPGITCPAGQINIAGTCRTGDIYQACAQAWGQLQVINNITVCKTTMPLQFTFMPTSQFVPVLTLGNTAMSLSTGIRVRIHDTLKFEGSGGWGAPDSALGGLVSYVTNSTCSTNPIDGPSGLFATDGTESFALGSASTKVITHDGDLRIGFNTTTAKCASASIKLQVTRCEDQAGNTYVCQ